MAPAYAATVPPDGSLDLRVFGAKTLDSRTSGTAFAPVGLCLVRPVLETNQIHAMDNTGASIACFERAGAILRSGSAREDFEGSQIGLT